MSVTESAKETWQDAKIKAADAGQRLRDLDREWKLSERFADLKDRLAHAEYTSATVAAGEFRRQFEMSMAYHAAHPEQIDERLAELEDEWCAEDVYRTALLGAGATGALLSKVRSRLWAVLPIAAVFLRFQNLRQDNPPGLAFVRRAGFRTRDEIEQEKYALKALRGDFAEVEGKRDDADQGE